MVSYVLGCALVYPFCISSKGFRHCKTFDTFIYPVLQNLFFPFIIMCSELSKIDGFQCLFFVDGFSKARLRFGFPPVILVGYPHFNIASSNQISRFGFYFYFYSNSRFHNLSQLKNGFSFKWIISSIPLWPEVI